jgi:hypothetical protein
MKPTLFESSLVKGGIAKDTVEASDGVNGNGGGRSLSLSWWHERNKRSE